MPKVRNRTTKNTVTRLELHEPFYRIGIDIVGPLPKTSRGNKFIVAATDHLTRWTEARVIKEKSTKNVAKFIFEEIIVRHGAPKYMVSDQGREFASRMIKDLSQITGTIQSFTSAYHP